MYIFYNLCIYFLNIYIYICINIYILFCSRHVMLVQRWAKNVPGFDIRYRFVMSNLSKKKSTRREVPVGCRRSSMIGCSLWSTGLASPAA